MEKAEPISGPAKRPDARPDPQWCVGTCPLCDEKVVSNVFYKGGKGYTIWHHCWNALGENPTCDYCREVS
jgi:hypothetical protein